MVASLQVDGQVWIAFGDVAGVEVILFIKHHNFQAGLWMWLSRLASVKSKVHGIEYGDGAVKLQQPNDVELCESEPTA